MPNITLGITGFHEILGGDWDPHWFRVHGRPIRVEFTFTIYLEKPEISVGKSDGSSHSVCRLLRNRF